MTAARKLSLRLLFLPFLLAAFDAIATLYYQPGDYWQGKYGDASDGNPFVLLALRIHPLLMIPGTAGWFLIVWFLLCQTAAWIALRSYVVLLIGHTIGGCGWLYRYHPHGSALYLTVAIVVMVIGFWAISPYLRYWSATQTLRHINLSKSAAGTEPSELKTFSI
jgi:hypothetical protein